MVAILNSAQQSVDLWDLGTGEKTLSLEGAVAGLSLTWSPSGDRVIGVGGGKLKVWDTQTGRRLLTRSEPSNAEAFLGFLPDGNKLVGLSTFYFEVPNVPAFWDVTPTE